jgi:hypothetical protein
LQPISGAVDVVRNPLPIGNVPTPPPPIAMPVITNMLPLDMALHEPNLPETETYSVELKKDDLGLGITVAGYVCERGGYGTDADVMGLVYDVYEC